MLVMGRLVAGLGAGQFTAFFPLYASDVAALQVGAMPLSRS